MSSLDYLRFYSGAKTRTKLLVVLLFCIALLPFVSLYWEDDLGFFKINWIVYPIFLSGIFVSVLLLAKTSRELLLLLSFTLLFAVMAVFKDGQVETVFRFFLAMLPLTLYSYFEGSDKVKISWFWVLYLASFALPTYYAFLQYSGAMEFNDFDVVDGEYLGRVSGGYSKPMNFIAFLLPIYLMGFYQWLVKKRRTIGYIIIIIVLIIIFIVGHRTSLLAFLVILASVFFKKITTTVIVNYYRYFINFFAGVFFVVFFYILHQEFGVIDIIRGRVPMWEAHSTQLLESRIDIVLFGAQKISLEKEYQFESIDIFGEVHNNTFRTIIFFGLVGFFIYSILIRSIVLRINSLVSPNLRFIAFSSFTYFILYSITNEPAYYASVLWPVLLWVFLANQMISNTENATDFA